MDALESARLRIAARMASIDAFEVMEIQTLAREVEASGRDVVHLEIGEPDFTTPKPIVEAAKRALDSQPMFYTSALGLASLREAISNFYRDRYEAEVPASRIIVTAGSSAALLLAFGVLLDASDEVLLSDPSYPCNRHFVHALGGVPRLVPVGPESRYQLTASLARAHWTGQTRIAMVATPSNPTGTMLTKDEVAELAALCREQSGTLLVDEIYGGLVYEGEGRHSAVNTGDDVVVINSFSKYFQMTVWRLGWMVVPANLVREVEKLAQNLFISPATPSQRAALGCFEPAALEIVERRRQAFEARRDFLVPALRELGFGVPVMPTGGFFVYADCSRFADDSDRFCRDALEGAGVAFTPGMDFGVHRARQHVRFAYTIDQRKLEDGVARLRDFLA